MTNFFTADTHFGHVRILELANRPFSSVERMNQRIVFNFNEQAGPDDTIYLLGDACMGQLVESLECIRQLRAKVVLIPGNHDRMSRANHKEFKKVEKRQKWVDKYLEVFDEVWLEDELERSVFPAPEGMEGFMMSHYPFGGDHTENDRHLDLRPIDSGLPLIHGHVHTLWKHNGRQFNVGVDVNDFRLVSESEILEWVAGLEAPEQLKLVAFTETLGPVFLENPTPEQREALQILSEQYGYDVAEVKD